MASGSIKYMTNIESRFISVLVTLPANTVSTIDLSSYIPQGKTVVGFSTPILHKGTARYALPYVNASNQFEAHVVRIDNNGMQIDNRESAWNDYYLEIVVYYS